MPSNPPFNHKVYKYIVNVFQTMQWSERNLKNDRSGTFQMSVEIADIRFKKKQKSKKGGCHEGGYGQTVDIAASLVYSFSLQLPLGAWFVYYPCIINKTSVCQYWNSPLWLVQLLTHRNSIATLISVCHGIAWPGCRCSCRCCWLLISNYIFDFLLWMCRETMYMLA